MVEDSPSEADAGLSGCLAAAGVPRGCESDRMGDLTVCRCACVSVCVSDWDSVRAAARQGEMMNDLSLREEEWSVPRAVMIDGCTLLTVVHRLKRLRPGFHSFPSQGSSKPGLLAVIRLRACDGGYR